MFLGAMAIVIARKIMVRIGYVCNVLPQKRGFATGDERWILVTNAGYAMMAMVMNMAAVYIQHHDENGKRTIWTLIP